MKGFERNCSQAGDRHRNMRVKTVLGIGLIALGCSGGQQDVKVPEAPFATASSGSDAAPATAAPTVLPPGASPELDPGALRDVEAALTAVGDTDFGLLERGDREITPKTCREWRGLREAGFYPPNTYEMHVDARAQVRCGTLEFLGRASPSRSSYVKGAIENAQPGALPAILATALSGEDESARHAAVENGKSLEDLIPDARLAPSARPRRITIAEPSGSRVTLHVEAWGDISGDGFEDLLVSVLNSVDQGTYFEMRLLRMTRVAPEGALLVIGE